MKILIISRSSRCHLTFPKRIIVCPRRCFKYEIMHSLNWCKCFISRLVTDEERKWTEENINLVAKKHFPTIDHEIALKRPILYSNWLTKDYSPVEQEELRDFVKARLKVIWIVLLIIIKLIKLIRFKLN